jgi:hypothetical protein
MKLTLHIVGKDLRHLRGRLGLWVAVLVAKTLLGFAVLAGDAPGYLARHATEASMVLIGLDAGLCFLLAALLVQEDPLVGARAFWLTRPVSKARMLTAKLLGAALFFGVTPLVVWLPWWLHCGYGLREIAWAAAETLYWQALVVVPAMLLAALTDSLSRMLLWAMVLLAAVPTGLAITGQWINEAPVGVGASRMTLMVVILVLAAAAAVVRQYFTRQQWRSLGWFGAGCVLALGVAGLWPWNLYAGWERRNQSEENAEIAAGAKLEFESAVAVAPDRRDLAVGRQRVDVSVRLTGLPANLVCAGDAVKQTWRWNEGPELSIDGWSWGTTDGFTAALGLAKREPDAETQQFQNKLRLARGAAPLPLPPAKEGQHFNVSGVGPRSLVVRLTREPAAYHATARFVLLRPEVRYDEALEASAWQAKSATGIRLTRVERRGEAVYLTQVQTGASLADQVLYGFDVWRGAQLARGDPSQHVINRALGDAIYFARNAMAPPVRIGTVMVRWITGEVKAPKVIRDGQWVPRDRDWFAGARFAVVGASEVGRFVRELRVEKFALTPEAEKK